RSLMTETNPRQRTVEIVNADMIDFEQKRSARVQAGLHEVFDHLVLGVHGDGAPTGQLGHVDVMTPAGEAEMNPALSQSLPLQPLSDTSLHHQVDRGLLQHSRPHTAFDVVPVSDLEDDTFDPFEMEEMSQHQAGGAGADDRDLGAHAAST